VLANAVAEPEGISAAAAAGTAGSGAAAAAGAEGGDTFGPVALVPACICTAPVSLSGLMVEEGMGTALRKGRTMCSSALVRSQTSSVPQGRG
jgi:hypothetical protein